jgi:hypothetical protein
MGRRSGSVYCKAAGPTAVIILAQAPNPTSNFRYSGLSNQRKIANRQAVDTYDRYPKKLATPGKSRSQVLDELAAAQRSGELNPRTADQSAN